MKRFIRAPSIPRLAEPNQGRERLNGAQWRAAAKGRYALLGR